MKRFMALCMASIVIIACGQVFAAEKPTKEALDFIATLKKYASDPVIVKVAKNENAKGKTMEQILELDKKYNGIVGVDPWIQSFMENEGAERLKAIQKEVPSMIEIMILDKQGALVSQTNKTNNYYKGKKPKFIETYNGGKGATFISDREFDDAVQVYVYKVCFPIMDEGVVIGVFSFSVLPAKMP